MIRVQLDLIFPDEESYKQVKKTVGDVLDHMASLLGEPSILKWSVEPLPTVSAPTIEPATTGGSHA